MKPPLNKAQYEIVTKLVHAFRKSSTVTVSIPLGCGKAAILAEVARVVDTPGLLKTWDEAAYHLAYYKYLAVKEVQECLEIGNEAAKKRRALTRAKLECMRRVVNWRKTENENHPKLCCSKHRR